MTFEELDERFPNGFDDAQIVGLSLDYPNRTATLLLSLRGNSPDSPERDEYRQAVLTLRDFYYFAIEPPDADHLAYRKHSNIAVDGFSEDTLKFPPFALLKPTLPAEAFACRFYVHDWNSFIHVASEAAEFGWMS